MKLKIISDGTNVGTHLIDSDTGEVIHKIQKLTWEADAKDFITKATVEFYNIPVEIVSPVNVSLFEHQAPNWEPAHTKDFSKNIKIISEGEMPKTKIYDNDTNELVEAVQEIKWEATPDTRGAKVKKIKFDKKDW